MAQNSSQTLSLNIAHCLFSTFNDDGTDKVANACLDRIRKIDPELAMRLSLRRHAEQEATGGVLKHKNPVIEKLLAEFYSLPLFDDTGLDEARQACLAKIREIDPDLASRLSSQFHADQHQAKDRIKELLDEWNTLPLLSANDDDEEARADCLSEIRMIDPDLALRLSLQHRAAQQKAANDPGG